ncbi:MAG TPA: hypothetical protein VN914_08145 [Polyangia bacterium]|nr:hypothetical protein [Polyangia bacterium]
MRHFLAWAIAGALLISACYQQPVISPQRPLRCDPAEEKGQCPKGFTCAVIGVCAPQSCSKDDDCPLGLSCSNRGCVPAPDGGAGDGSIQIPVLPDGAQRPDFGGDDAVVTPDLAADASMPDGGQQ